MITVDMKCSQSNPASELCLAVPAVGASPTRRQFLFPLDDVRGGAGRSLSRPPR